MLYRYRGQTIGKLHKKRIYGFGQRKNEIFLSFLYQRKKIQTVQKYEKIDEKKYEKQLEKMHEKIQRRIQNE